jgi:hypothetical protein
MPVNSSSKYLIVQNLLDLPQKLRLFKYDKTPNSLCCHCNLQWHEMDR